MSMDKHESASGNGRTDSAAELAAQEDAAAVNAYKSGAVQTAVQHIKTAERHAWESGNNATRLRSLVRAEVLIPNADRVRVIGTLAPGKPMAELIEEHAGDFLGVASRLVDPPSPATSRRTARLHRRGVAEASRTWKRSLRVVGAWMTAVAIGFWSLLTLVPPSPTDAGGMQLTTQLRGWFETVLGALFGITHVSKALFYDPVSRTVSVIRSAVNTGGAASALCQAATAVWKTTTGHTVALILLAALATIAVRIVFLHMGVARCRPGDQMIFAGRRLWYSYHRRLMVPPLAALCSIAARELDLPTLAIPFDAIATLGLVAVMWKLIPATRPLLVVAESPRDVRLATIELLSGLARPHHIVLPAYEIRAAVLAPTSRWNLAQDIQLRKANGEVVLLEGFAGPHRARDLVSSINRLVHGVPPLQSAGTPTTRAHN